MVPGTGASISKSKKKRMKRKRAKEQNKSSTTSEAAPTVRVGSEQQRQEEGRQKGSQKRDAKRLKKAQRGGVGVSTGVSRAGSQERVKAEATVSPAAASQPFVPRKSSSSGVAAAPPGVKAGKPWKSISPALHTLACVHKLGFPFMTPVQAATIPAFLQHKDVCVNACTGSGKTLAFVIPTYEMLLRRKIPLKSHQVGAIIISPTRELAMQIHRVCKHFTKDFPLVRLFEMIGGTHVDVVVNRFRENGGNVVVATPGRLDSMLERLHKHGGEVKELEVLILDEADRLLDMGFETVISNVLKRLPKQRRTGLFSATQTKELKALVRAGLRNPATIDVQVTFKARPGASKEQILREVRQVQTATPNTLRNFYTIIRPEHKLNALVHFLVKMGKAYLSKDSKEAAGLPSVAPSGDEGKKGKMVMKASKRSVDIKIIMFVLTCAQVDYFASILPSILQEAWRRMHRGDAADKRPSPGQALSFSVMGLHGKQMQKKRNKIYSAFAHSNKTNKAAQGSASTVRVNILISTDLAARGIDIPDVHWILQYDPPQNPAFFVHRIGRTARMGKDGHAMVFLTPQEDAYVSFLRVNKVPIEAKSISPSFAVVEGGGGGGEGAAQEKEEEEVDEEAGAASGEGDEGEEGEQLGEQEAEEGGEGGRFAWTKEYDGMLEAEQEQGEGAVDGNGVWDALPSVRVLALQDRAFMEKGQRALVSYVRAYKEHECRFIFLYKRLPVVELARGGFGLLFLPVMADLKHRRLRWKNVTRARPFQIRYPDPEREKGRLKELHSKRERRKKEREERETAAFERRKAASKAKPKRSKGKRLHEQFKAEWADLQSETRLLKKLKKGLITQKQFEIATGERLASNGEESDAADSAGGGDNDA